MEVVICAVALLAAGVLAVALVVSVFANRVMRESNHRMRFELRAGRREPELWDPRA